MQLAQKSPNYNESTIFRGIKQFKDKNIISEVELNEGFKRYEVKPVNHHHHFIKCKVCEEIKTLNQCNLSFFIKQIKQLGFKNIDHKIEFFGICGKCRKAS
jgi:Fur family ferric uptake transcriptional regulator